MAGIIGIIGLLSDSYIGTNTFTNTLIDTHYTTPVVFALLISLASVYLASRFYTMPGCIVRLSPPLPTLC